MDFDRGSTFGAAHGSRNNGVVYERGRSKGII